MRGKAGRSSWRCTSSTSPPSAASCRKSPRRTPSARSCWRMAARCAASWPSRAPPRARRTSRHTEDGAPGWLGAPSRDDIRALARNNFPQVIPVNSPRVNEPSLRAARARASVLRLGLLAALLVLTLRPIVSRATINVGVSDWTGWVAWYVAQDQGYFSKYGADVHLVWFANYSDSISALSTGQLDANSQTWSDTLGPLAKGLPLKVVLVNDNSAGNDALLVGPQIKSFAQLRHHTV